MLAGAIKASFDRRIRKELNMDIGKQHYRNLAHWNQSDWEQIDIHLFIAANFTRYCSYLIKRVGLQYLPSDATDSLLGLFCDVAWRPLKAVHEKNLDAVGERRNQVMLGTLKMITFTRMVDALIREYPSYVALEQLPEFMEDDALDGEGDDDSLHHIAYSHEYEPSQRALFAAESHDLDLDWINAEDTGEEDRVSTMVEIMRSHLTPVQYRHLRYTICERMDTQEIAEHTGHSVTNARIILLNTRKKMMEMVPRNLAGSVADCVRRK